MNIAKDAQGFEFKVGQKVAVADKYFRTDGLHVVIKKVTKVDGCKVYLDESSRPLNFPERIAIVKQR